MSKKIKILRTASGSMPCFGLLNEIKKEGAKVIAVDCNPISFGLYITDKSYVVPRADDPNYINKIIEIINKEKPDAILTVPEEETEIINENRKNVEDKGCLVLKPDYEIVKKLIEKKSTYELLDKIGIPYPKIYENTQDVTYPCIMKPNRGRGSANVFKVESKNELDEKVKYVKDPIIQEFVEGQEFSIDILGDRNGNALSIVPRIRIDTESGISVKGKTVYDREIINFCKKIVKELKLFGPSCIQCIKNDKEIKFIEVNLRFGGGSILSINADRTIIPNLIRLIKGEEPIKSSEFIDGLIMMRHYSDIFIEEKDIKK